METPTGEFAKAVADDTRQRIMAACCCKWLSVSEIVEKANVTQPTVSHHLAVLRDADLVRFREDGRQTFYTLNQERVVECCGRIMLRFAPEQAATSALEKLIKS
jgi:ArsR family transcriptional regulator